MRLRVFIIGGGVTGLACAYRLARESDYEVIIFEAEEHFGGLARNFGSDGWHFEFGPHNIHTQNDEIIKFLKEILGPDLKERAVTTTLYFRGQKVSYPLKGLDVLTSLSPLEMVLTGWNFFLARLRAFLFGIKGSRHFDDWVIRRFGRRLFDIYFAPYVRKVWKIEPRELSNYVGVSRIPVISIRQMIFKQLGFFLKKMSHPEEAAYELSYLPVHGSGRITETLRDSAQKAGAVFHNNTWIKSIALEDNRIARLQAEHRGGAEDNLKSYPVGPEDLVISTIPINRLLDILSPRTGLIEKLIGKLDYTSLVLFYLKVKAGTVFNRSWVYFSKEQLLFNRITEHSHDETQMVPPGYVSLCVELPCNTDDEIWKMSEPELFEAVYRELQDYVKLDREAIAGYFRREVRYAYPRFKVDFFEHLTAIINYFQEVENFVTLGRQGLFCYANIDQCINMSFKMCDTIIHDPAGLKTANRAVWENSFPNKIACEC